jgi:hypothetical protein
MRHTYEEILQIALELPAEERLALADSIMAEIEPDEIWGEPEPGHDEWVRKGIEESLADESGDVSHEEAMRQFHEAILNARKLKATA